jgi:hypothetical protein
LGLAPVSTEWAAALAGPLRAVMEGITFHKTVSFHKTLSARRCRRKKADDASIACFGALARRERS